jgi:hypothetical protein
MKMALIAKTDNNIKANADRPFTTTPHPIFHATENLLSKEFIPQFRKNHNLAVINLEQTHLNFA